MNNRGITIIELIFVLLLMSIIVAIVVPRLDFSDYQLKVYGRQIVSDLNLIKTKSMTDGMGVTNKITFNEKYYHVKLTNTPSRKVSLKSNFKIADNILDDNTINFHPNGTPSPACTIRVFNNTNNRYIEITVSVGTGRIHMYDEIKQGYSPEF